jgi:hypothetical protein
MLIMKPSLWRRAVLAAVLGSAVWSGLARASDEFPKVPPGATELPPGVPPVDNSPSKRPLRDWLFRHRPLGCWSSFNGYGCDSFHSTTAFVFGSCRTFFGEPCLKGAPPSPLPPWYDPKGTNGAYGPNGPNGTAPPRCGCP